MALTITANGTTLPSPVSLSTTDELIWSANTGRSTETGTMIGDVVARKKTINVEWGPLTRAQFAAIRSAVTSDAFFTVTLALDGSSLESFTSYRGELSGEVMGVYDGTMYYRSASVSFVQK